MADPGMKILVVEDEPISALSITWELESAGHTVTGPAARIEDALRLVRLCRPDLVLLDIDLEQEGDGLKLAETFREMDIATVFVSGKGSVASQHSELALGFIGKPYNPADIPRSVAAIGAVLSGQTLPEPMPLSLRLFDSIIH